jgi:hypothetical protein
MAGLQVCALLVCDLLTDTVTPPPVLARVAEEVINRLPLPGSRRRGCGWGEPAAASGTGARAELLAPVLAFEAEADRDGYLTGGRAGA